MVVLPQQNLSMIPCRSMEGTQILHKAQSLCELLLLQPHPLPPEGLAPHSLLPKNSPSTLPFPHLLVVATPVNLLNIPSH